MLFNRTIIKGSLYALCLLFISSVISCAGLREFTGDRHKEIRAYIDKNPEWKMVENCGYENCQPMVDVLIGKDVAAKIEFFRDNKNLSVDITLNFTNVNEPAEFNTSNIFFTLKNGEVLKSKIFKCGKTKAEIDYLLKGHSERDLLRQKPSLEGPVSIKKLDCFRFFFDHPAPLPDEEIIMEFNNALTLNGKPANVPVIHFRKNPLYKESH